MSSAAYKRGLRVRKNEVGLTCRNTPIKNRVLSDDPEAVKRRKRRAEMRERGLNSRGTPMLRARHAEAMAGNADPNPREQRSWWLVTTQVPEPTARLLEATGAWGATRFWEGGRLDPYRDETSLGDHHEAA